jgi:DNA-binding LacI/PurR family transcriptional regulator
MWEHGFACQWDDYQENPDFGRRLTAPAVGSDEDCQRWLAALPRPTGVFVRSDDGAVQIAERAAQAGLSVPEEIATLGADNDELICKFAGPPLSSVAVPSERIGHEASRLLERLLQGRTISGSHMMLAISDCGFRSSAAANRLNSSRSTRSDDEKRDCSARRANI